MRWLKFVRRVVALPKFMKSWSLIWLNILIPKKVIAMVGIIL